MKRKLLALATGLGLSMGSILSVSANDCTTSCYYIGSPSLPGYCKVIGPDGNSNYPECDKKIRVCKTVCNDDGNNGGGNTGGGNGPGRGEECGPGHQNGCP